MKQHAGASRSVKSERLEARVTTDQKAILQHAAALRGLSLTDFLVTSAQSAAENIIREHDIITLSARDSAAFAEALLNPGKPNVALQDALARHDEKVISQQ